MKSLVIIAAVMSMLALAPPATAAKHAHDAGSASIWIGTFGHLNGWRAVSRNEIIVWASPSRPYLITMRRPHSALRFADAIGVTSTAGRISKFETVIVDGWRMPIQSIVALDRRQAKAMRWQRSAQKVRGVDL